MAGQVEYASDRELAFVRGPDNKLKLQSIVDVERVLIPQAEIEARERWVKAQLNTLASGICD